ncbi:tuberin-like [Asterias rubens]|uniref:tuberin-like n=1 Tax=Asterias rubens TaxID=7604 RepID=UPI0014556F2F|nr:tuberin-like [Asterias rubens]
MRIENGGALLPTTQDFPLADVSSLLLRNRELDLDIDRVDFVEYSDQEMMLDNEREGEAELEDQEMKGAHQSRSATKQQDGGEDFQLQGFSKPELGLSPLGHDMSYYIRYSSAHRDSMDQSINMATILADTAKDLENIAELVEESDPNRMILPRSSSCPDIIESVTSIQTSSMGSDDQDNISTSPRNMVKSFMEKQMPTSSSYKEMSVLEQRLQRDEVALGFVRRASTTANEDETVSGEAGKAKDLEDPSSVKTDSSAAAAKLPPPKFLTPEDSASDTPGQMRRRVRPAEKRPRPVSLPPQTDAENLDGKQQGFLGEDDLSRHSQGADLQPLRRPRGHTMSSLAPNSTADDHAGRKRRASENRSRVMTRTGLSPSFVFLQMYYSPVFSDDQERPLALPFSQVTQRAVKVLDRIPPYDTHKIGVLYVGSGQTNDQATILSNLYGSARYVEFLQGLGRLISLKDVCPNEVYTGGLDHQGSDGKFAYWWHDDIMQVIFHVATLMPNKESDPTCNSKKLHIGNDFVSIVYNERNEPYKLGTIKGQFNFAEIVIEPLDSESNLVTVQAKPDLEAMIGSRGPRMITNKNLPLLVRQMALHANLASQIYQSQMRGTLAEAYTSNWLERLRQIKRLRGKISQGTPVNSLAAMAAASSVRQQEKRKGSPGALEDFTDYA